MYIPQSKTYWEKTRRHCRSSKLSLAETAVQKGISDVMGARSRDYLDNVVVTCDDIQSFASRLPANAGAQGLRHFHMSLRSYNSAHTKVAGDIANGSRPEIRDLDRARQWKDSGLQFSSDSELRYPSLVASSLVDSISFGGIKSLDTVDEPTGIALRSFTEHVLGVSVEIGNTSPQQPAHYTNADCGRTPSGTLYSELIVTAFGEPSSANFQGKYLHGPQYERLLVPHDKAVSELNGLGIDDNPAVLQPLKYQEPDVRDYVMSLDSETQQRIDRVKYYRKKELQSLSSDIYEDDIDNVLLPDVLNDPGYCRQTRVDSCAAAGLRMLFKGVTGGELLNDADIDFALASTHRPPIIQTESYVNVLGSDAFKKEYDKRVIMRMFAGFDMGKIAKIAKTIKAKQVGAQIFTVLNLNSETLSDGTWHTNVLLSAGAETVTTHDPASNPKYGQPNREQDKESFYRRWAATGNSGYMVIVP